MITQHTTPGSPDAQGRRPPNKPPTPQCLFPSAIKTGSAVAPADWVGGSIEDGLLESSKYHDATYADGPDDITFEELQQALKTMAGTIVTPVDALVRFHHGTAHFPDDYEIDGVMVTALLKLSGASATDIRTLFRELAESPRDQDAPAADTTTTLVSTGADPSASAGLLTSLAPSPADSTSRGLGAQVAKATARDTEHLCGPSPIPHRDVPGAQVPMEDTICRPLLPDGLTEATEATAAPQIPDNLVQFPGGPVPTVPQPTPQAARTSMDAASPDSVAASADRAQGQSGTSKCPTFAYRKPKTIEANPTCRLQPPDGKTDPRDAQSPPDQQREDISMPPPLRLPSPESLDVAALHITPPLNPASCKTRGPSVCMGVTTLDLISASEDRGECRNPLPIPSSHPQSAAVASLHITPPLNPAPCTTREPSVDVEATAPDLTSNPPDENEMLADMLQAEEEENEEEEIHHGMQAEDEEDEGVQDEEEMLQQLITQCHNWECTEGHSAVFLIATMLADTFPPGKTPRHYQVARQLRQFPSNPWEDYRDTVPVQAFLEATRARASRSFAGGGTRRWLTASNLELPERLVDDVARRSAPLPEEMLRPH